MAFDDVADARLVFVGFAHASYSSAFLIQHSTQHLRLGSQEGESNGGSHDLRTERSVALRLAAERGAGDLTQTGVGLHRTVSGDRAAAFSRSHESSNQRRGGDA